MFSMHSIVRRRDWGSAFMLLIVASLLAACGASTSTSSPSTSTSQPTATVPQVTIIAKDFSFAMPDTLHTGLVDITLTNQGTQPNQAQLERLNNGVTQAQVLAAFTKGPEAFLPLLSSYGGANAVDPGQSQEVILNIAQGQYIMLCFVSGPDHIPHVIKGMYKFFTVTGPSNVNQVSQPQDNGQVMLRDFSIVLPASIPAGLIMLHVTNQGSQPHEMDVLKLMPGKSVKDALAFCMCSWA